MTTDPHAPAHRAPRRRRWSPSHTLVGVIALLFFFGPAFAAVVGVRAQDIENKKLASFPAASQGWSIFGNFDAWATDHLPLRDSAVRTNSAAERDIFRETPNYAANGQSSTTSNDTAGVAGLPGVGAPQPTPTQTPTSSSSSSAATTLAYPTVVGGTNGWLYYGSDFANACLPTLSPTVIAQRFQQLSDIIRKAGKKFVLVVAPDKSDVYPQYIPNSVTAKYCAGREQKAFWAAIDAHPPTGYVDVHDAIVQAIAANPAVPIYYKTDTHWDNAGSLIYAKMLANALNPQIWATSTVADAGPVSKPTDLSALLGTPKSETQETYTVTRPGVHNIVDDKMTKIANSTTGAPLVPGKTLLISDSFTEAANFAISGFFTDASIINPVAACAGASCLPPGTPATNTNLEATIKASSTVVLEVVERAVVGGQASILGSDFQSSLAAYLGES